MPSSRIMLRIFLSVFIGTIFPPALILIWKGRFRDFVIVLVVFLALMSFMRSQTGWSVLLAIYYILEFRAEIPTENDVERDL